MIWIILIIIGLGIYGMVWISRISYKGGKRNIDARQEGQIRSLNDTVVRCRQRIIKAQKEKEKWELRFDEMETRWRESKKRRQELRLEKLELEAQISDLLGQQLKSSIGEETEGQDELWDDAALTLFKKHNPYTQLETEIGKQIYYGFVRDMNDLKSKYTLIKK